jgi:hypothetical protein
VAAISDSFIVVDEANGFADYRTGHYEDNSDLGSFGSDLRNSLAGLGLWRSTPFWALPC